MKIKTTILFTIMSLLFACTNSKKVSDKEFSSIIVKLEELSKAEGSVEDSVQAFLSTKDLLYINFQQIEEIISLRNLAYKSDALRSAIFPALNRISKQSDIVGAQAASLKVLYIPGYNVHRGEPEFEEGWVHLFKKLTGHPAFEELVCSDDKFSDIVFTRLQFVENEAINGSGLMDELQKVLKMPLSYKLAKSSIFSFDVALNPKTGLSPNKIEEFRILCSRHTSNAIDSLEISTNKYQYSKSTLAYLKEKLLFLEGPTAKRELINSPSPEINFLWCSNGKTKKLSDLVGKVVIIDFWATWCGPCVGSFPNLRKLQERYEKYDVEIVGITSIQGYHSDPVSKKRIMLKDKPDEEMALMTDYMEKMQMNWKVVFSETSVFNTNYGVRGIPHVAIIDSEGKVRYNKLRPYDAPWHEAEKIDQLLKEAGLPYPETPMEKTNFANL